MYIIEDDSVDFRLFVHPSAEFPDPLADNTLRSLR